MAEHEDIQDGSPHPLMYQRCPTCGTDVRVVSGDEGTSHYEVVAEQRLSEAQRERDEARNGSQAWRLMSQHRTRADAYMQRAQQAEADNERLRSACNRHTDEIIELLDAIERHETTEAASLGEADTALYAAAARIKRPASVKDERTSGPHWPD